MQRIFRLFLIALLLAGAAFTWLILKSLKAGEFTIKPGSSVRAVAQQLAAQGTGVSPLVFQMLARGSGQATRLKAGSYTIKAHESTWDILQKMVRGEVTLATLVLVEGSTLGQFRRLLAQHGELVHDTKALSDSQLLQKLGITLGGAGAEGLFFPDTYSFAKSSSELDVLKRAADAMRQRLDAAWALRAPSSVLKTPYEALILASIIEKETGTAADRAMIASVFHNRLKIGMRLQTDPTVIYGLGASFDGNLRKRDLLADTPYNTYTRAGLPPTPISLPGAAALTAALQPASSRNLYFVARGDGSSEFSETLEAHNRAVNKYQRGG